MKKINGEKLELVLMAGHITMLNWDAMNRRQLRAAKLERLSVNVAFWLVIGLMISLTISMR